MTTQAQINRNLETAAAYILRNGRGFHNGRSQSCIIGMSAQALGFGDGGGGINKSRVASAFGMTESLASDLYGGRWPMPFGARKDTVGIAGEAAAQIAADLLRSYIKPEVAETTSAAFNANIRKGIEFIRANAASFNQGRYDVCAIGMMLRGNGLPASYGRSEQRNAAIARLTGISESLASDIFTGSYPGEFRAQYLAASVGHGEADVAARMWESLLKPEASAPAPVEDFGKVVRLLVFSGRVSQSDVTAASEFAADDKKLIDVLLYAGKVATGDVSAARALLSA